MDVLQLKRVIGSQQLSVLAVNVQQPADLLVHPHILLI